MLFTAKKFRDPLNFTEAVIGFFGGCVNHKIAQITAVYLNVVLDEEKKAKVAEGLGYTKLTKLPTDEQRKEMAIMGDELIAELIESNKKALKINLDRLAEIQAHVDLSREGIEMLRAELKLRQENPNV